MRFLRPTRRAQTLQRLKQVTKKHAVTKLQKAFRKNKTLKQTLNKMRKTYKSVDIIPSLIDQKLNQVSQATYKQDFNQPEIANKITGHLYKGEAILAILIEQLRKAPSVDAALLMFKNADTRTLSNILPDEKHNRMLKYIGILESASYQLHKRALKLKYARIWAAMSPKERAAARKKAKKKLKDEKDWAPNVRLLDLFLEASKVGPTDIKAKNEVSRQEKLMESDMKHAALLPAILADQWTEHEKKADYPDDEYDAASEDEGIKYNSPWWDNYINWGSLINDRYRAGSTPFDYRFSDDYFTVDATLYRHDDSELSSVSQRSEWNGKLFIVADRGRSWHHRLWGLNNINVRVKVNDINNDDIFNDMLSNFPKPFEIPSASILYIKLDFTGDAELDSVKWKLSNASYGDKARKRLQYDVDMGFYDVDGPILEGIESGFYKYNLSRIPSNVSELTYEILMGPRWSEGKKVDKVPGPYRNIL